MGEAADRSETVVLVALQGNEADAQVVTLACIVARDRGALLRGVYVIEVPHAQSLASWSEDADEMAQGVLNSARKTAQRSGCGWDASVLPTRDAGQAIVDEAVEVAANIVVLAKPFKAKRGDAALHVLDKAPCEVLVWRPPKR